MTREAVTWRRITACVLLILLLALYASFRYSALSMEQSDLPAEYAVRIENGADVLMTFQSGDPSGRPIIFVHGTPGAADNWSHFLRNPRSGLRIIAVDRPGFGDSTPRDGLPRLEDQAAALKPLLESLRGRNPILVGHSLGGPIICQAALDFPELVGGLVIVAGSLDPSVEKVFAIQYFGDLPGIRRILPRALRNSNRELISLRADLERLVPRLEHIACPVSIIHGTEDMLVPFENMTYMESALPPDMIHAVVTLEGENHFLPWTAPQAIWDAVERLVAE